MSGDRHHAFDEELFTGLLDGALTQAEEQRVRVHLEDCARCRDLFDEMKILREATMTTRFEMPADREWDERPRGALSRLSRGLGWTVLVVWFAALVSFAAGQLWSGPQSLVEKLLIFGGMSGVVLLFLSVLLDRLRSLKTDRYRGVER